jgi:hypothetical protein
MFSQQTKKTVHAKEAKIVKLNRLYPNASTNRPTLTRYESNLSNDYSFNGSFESSTSSSSSFLSSSPSINRTNSDNDVSGEFLTTQLYILQDYSPRLNYGDLSVRRGDLVYLICDLSESYFFVEDMNGAQGFVPKKYCINLDETIKSAKEKLVPMNNCKITSL